MDKSAFTRLILANEQQLYRIAKSILKKDEDCADAAQEAIAAGFASLHTLRDDRYAKTWLIRILINQCYRILRENSRHLPLEEYADGISPPQEETYSDLYQALLSLPCELRLLLVMHYLEGYSIQEMAKILDVPLGTVKSRMARGREKLRRLLD